MPCYHCGLRQVDPARGPSPWKRGVIHDEQVLVCPDCQRTHDWVADLDTCGSCGSTMLVRQLGETRCRQCGWARPAPADPEVRHGVEGVPGLAADVAAALDRVLGRRPAEGGRGTVAGPPGA